MLLSSLQGVTVAFGGCSGSSESVEFVKRRGAMQDLFQIVLPKNTSNKDIEALQSDLKALDAVADTDSAAPRGLDPSSILIAIQLVSGALCAVTAAVSLMQKVIEVVRGKGISGAVIKLPNGFEISVDKATASEIERLLSTVGQSHK